jgi:RNase adaptor protein for sRNA GlmZ degradation
MTDTATNRVGLLITGIPGAGKSTFLDHLESCGWRVLRGDEPNGWPPGYHEAWNAALGGSPATLVSLAQLEAVGLAIEWGFKEEHLKNVLALHGAGFEAWFLDGDDEAAYERWRRVHPRSPRSGFDDQITGLRGISGEIATAFGERRIVTVPAGGPDLTVEEIDAEVVGTRSEISTRS